jgi:predicted transglutaminase-like cysteine proteinase
MSDHEFMSMGIARLAAAGCLAVLVPVASPVAAAPPYDFAGAAYLAPASSLPDWADTVERNNAEQQTIAECLADESVCQSRLIGIRHLLTKAQSLPREKQIRLINRYVNKRRYRDDRSEHKVSSVSNRKAVFRNHWSTVMDFVRRGGDCEDYATTKYFLLRTLGFASDDMRVVVVYDGSVRDYHAVLAVRITSDSTWLLESDNTIQKGVAWGYRYVFAINEDSIWDHEGADG